MGLFSSIGKAIKGVLGLDDGKDLAKRQEALLRQQAEQAKLNAANEVQNVTQFDETPDASFVGSDTRRKKRTTSSYASAIGLTI